MKTKEIKIKIHEGEGLHVLADHVDEKDVMIMMGSALGELADEFSKNDEEFDKELFFNAVTDFAKLPRPLKEVMYSLLGDDDEND